MKRILGLAPLFVAFIVLAGIAASAAVASPARSTTAPSLNVTQIVCPAGYTGGCVTISGCGYATHGVRVALRSPGQLGRNVSVGTNLPPAGCFNGLVVGALALVSWTVTATDTAGGSQTYYITLT